MRERTAATPAFFVPTVTLEVGIALKRFPQFGQTLNSSETSFPHFGQKGNNYLLLKAQSAFFE
jgi:hypothetical protein